MPGALKRAGGCRDKVMASRNIIKFKLFHPAENRVVAAGGADAHSNLGWKDMACSSAAWEELLLQGNVGVEEEETRCAAKAIQATGWKSARVQKCSNY